LRETVLARRYARALFMLALERDLLDKIHQELEAFAEILRDNRDLRLFLSAPQVDRSEKRRVVESLFQDRFSNVFFNFLMLLIEKGRQALFSEIVEQFGALYDRHRNRVRALAISAIPLEEHHLDELRRALAGHLRSEVKIDNQVDPSILGGLVVKIDGQVLDGSIRSQLKRLGESLLDHRN
jgi:F-type H+-transporting ATPase subunit delta